MKIISNKISHGEKILKNLIDPETGLYILNCARNIIAKQNVNQVDLFL